MTDFFNELDALEGGRAKKQRRGDQKSRRKTDAPETERVIRVTTCMTPTQRDRLREMAYKRGVSRASIIARLIDEEWERTRKKRRS